MPNLLNETLRAIKNTKTILNKQLQNTTDEHQKQKLEHQIHCLTMEETNILKQIEQ